MIDESVQVWINWGLLMCAVGGLLFSAGYIYWPEVRARRRDS